jgi:hypothetical protein
MSDGYPISGDEMSGDNGTGDGARAGGIPPASGSASFKSRTPFPWERFFYSVGFGVVAWCVFWTVIVVALMQFVLVLLQSVTANVTGHPSDELKRFCLRMIQYLLELLAYITFARDTPPFPFSPFPNVPQANPGA